MHDDVKEPYGHLQCSYVHGNRGYDYALKRLAGKYASFDTPIDGTTAWENLYYKQCLIFVNYLYIAYELTILLFFMYYSQY